jgi:hypothetical protein
MFVDAVDVHEHLGDALDFERLRHGRRRVRICRGRRRARGRRCGRFDGQLQDRREVERHHRDARQLGRRESRRLARISRPVNRGASPALGEQLAAETRKRGNSGGGGQQEISAFHGVLSQIFAITTSKIFCTFAYGSCPCPANSDCWSGFAFPIEMRPL